MVRGLGLLCASAFLVAACGGGSGSKANQANAADVYTAVLRELVPATTNGGPDSVVYVAPFEEQKAFPLETQAAVIADLTDEATVRFVDELSEAVDDGNPGSPAKGTEVVLLGPVPSGAPPIEVEAQRYQSDADQTRYRFLVTATGDGGWSAVEVESRVVAPTTTEG